MSVGKGMGMIGGKRFAFQAAVGAIWYPERIKMLRHHEILHAIRGHFANPYAAAERFRLSENFTLRPGRAEDTAYSPKRGSRIYAFLHATSFLIHRAPPVPTGVAMVGIGIYILVEGWGYPRNPSTLIVIESFLSFHMLFNGAELIAKKLIPTRKAQKSDLFIFKIFVCICSFIISLVYTNKGILFAFTFAPGFSLFSIIQSYRQGL